MSHSIHRGWGYKLVSWIPGLGSSNANMAQNLVFTEAFEHRYASPKRLLEILQNQPFSFQENEIQINATSGSGLKVKLPRRLNLEEREKIIEALDNTTNPGDE